MEELSQKMLGCDARFLIRALIRDEFNLCLSGPLASVEAQVRTCTRRYEIASGEQG